MAARLLFASLIVLLPATPAVAATILELGAERIVAEDWRISGLRAVVEIDEGALRGEIRIARLELPAAGLDIADSVITCGQILLSRAVLRCAEGVLAANIPLIGRQQVAASFDYDRDGAATTFVIEGLALAGGRVRLEGATDASGTTIAFSGESLAIDGLLAAAQPIAAVPEGVSASGAAAVSGKLVLAGTEGFDLSLDATLEGAGAANAAGTAVGDALHGRVRLDASRTADGWRFDVDVTADSGEVYVEPVYANLAEQALHLETKDLRTADFTLFEIGRFRLEQGRQVTVAGDARVSLPVDETPLTVHRAALELSDTAVDAVYGGLLQVFLAGSVLGDLDTAGRVSGTVAIRDNAPAAARLALDEVILDDQKGRFAVYELSGTLDWPGSAGAPEDANASRLAWASASVGNILLAGAEAHFRLGGDDVVLLEPLRLPTMGGALRVNRLAVRDYGGDDARTVLDAELEPVQLGQLTGAFGWPAFSGTLSGRLPTLQYEGNAMTVGGTLTAQAFDGSIDIADLRVQQPFARVPRLAADIRLRNLDLERLTDTFSFGLIQGRLSGDVTGLRLAAWRPVAMDLHLYTPEGDRSPRRISQRAVENLASVGGGGAGAVLSSGLLQFFEVFAYDRIGLRCVLADGICRMSGAGPAGEGALGRGYYIVKGKGIPRIDVVGYRDQVNWPALMRQLEAITRSDAPVVN